MNDPMFCSMLISVAFKKLGAFPSTMSDYLTPKVGTTLFQGLRHNLKTTVYFKKHSPFAEIDLCTYRTSVNSSNSLALVEVSLAQLYSFQKKTNPQNEDEENIAEAIINISNRTQNLQSSLHSSPPLRLLSDVSKSLPKMEIPRAFLCVDCCLHG
tara:strand:+ start:257 stop:721 length:465 start_codon:yes stop_codon:yes gene_type:complete